MSEQASVLTSRHEGVRALLGSLVLDLHLVSGKRLLAVSEGNKERVSLD